MTLAELTDSVKARGVLQAISVRRPPLTPDRWMVNFGTRRLRASRLAGKPPIPAYVGSAMDCYDQVIENEQRESLSPLELAMFVQKKLQSGARSSDIARTPGKSRGYLTFIGALIDPPAWLLDLYRIGRCRGISELYELHLNFEYEAKWLSCSHICSLPAQTPHGIPHSSSMQHLRGVYMRVVRAAEQL